MSTSPPPIPVQLLRRGLSCVELAEFNQHLAALATAGLPLEQGIRLAADDARSSRVKRELDALATDLESGMSLSDAFDRRRGTFPTMYANLMSAAVATGNLPALLLALGRHQKTTEDLKSALAKALAYPLSLLAGVCVVTVLIARVVLPQLRDINGMFGKTMITWNSFSRGGSTPELPMVTQFVLDVGPYLPSIAALALGIICLIPIVVFTARVLRADGALADACSSLPLVGPPLRLSAMARFSDALAIAVSAPVDLPRALRMAGGIVGHPRLQADAEALASAAESGRPLAEVPTRRISRTFNVAVAHGTAGAELPGTLESLALLYRKQAEYRVQRIPLLLLPLCLLAIGAMLALLLSAIVLPIVQLLRSLA